MIESGEAEQSIIDAEIGDRKSKFDQWIGTFNWIEYLIV